MKVSLSFERGESMIEGIDICKKFGEHIIFDHYSFRIDIGEFVCFAGASGTGKQRSYISLV